MRELRLALARYQVRFLESVWRASDNPVHVWKAWRWCRRHGLPPPEWVLAYLDRCAERVSAGQSDAVGLMQRKGGAGKQARAPAQIQQAAIAQAVGIKQRYPEITSENQAVTEVARDFKVSERTVWRALTRTR